MNPQLHCSSLIKRDGHKYLEELKLGNGELTRMLKYFNEDCGVKMES